MIKPLFDATTSAHRDTPTVKAADDESDNEQENPKAEKEDDEVYSDDLIGTADTAPTAYDEIAEGATSLPSSRFDDLLDVVGEGFYGDEKDEQLAIIDPSSTGTITKKAFVSWYVNFVTATDADDDESASLDTADREEREEERQNADQAFTDTVGEGVDVIDSAAFGDLIESMGTTYCEEEHRRTIKKISGADGKISRDAFIAWYLDWLFGGDESDIETDEEDEAGEEEERPATSGGEGWGNAFGVEEGSWKCDACMVRNKAGDTKCAACETVRPGYEDKQEESSDSAAASGSAIGAGGFSFGGGASTAAAAAPSIGSGGFSFGGATTSAPAPAPAPVTAVSSGGGFSFGAKPSSTATSSTTGGFSFGAPPAPAGKVPDKAEKKKDEKAVSSSSASFPPLATKAPTPFSATAKASAAAPAATAKPAASSSAFPPMSTAAPKNPFSATAKAPVAAAPAPAPAPAAKPAASSSAFPPMSTAAPKNPFSAPSKPPAPAPAPAAKPAASSSAFPPTSTAAPNNPFASVKLTSTSATIGSTSTSGGFSFGTPSTLGGGSGAPATTKGGFSFGSTGSATFGSPPAKLEAPKATEQEKSAPIFGSGSKAPVFGSGSGVGGFAALASSPAPAGGGAGRKTSSTGFGGSSSSTTSGVSGVDSSMVKPLFGSVPAAAPAPTSEAAPAPAPTFASAPALAYASARTAPEATPSIVDDSTDSKKKESSLNSSGISEIVSSDSEDRSEDESAAAVSIANSISSGKLVFGEKFFGSIPSPGRKESSATTLDDNGKKKSTIPTAVNTVSTRTPDKNARDASSSPGSGYKGWKEVISNDKSTSRSIGKGTKITSAPSTSAKPSPKALPKASPSLMREKSLQGSLEEKIRGMNKSPTTPPKKAHTEIKASTPSSAKSSSSVPSYLRSTFASRRQQLEKDDTRPTSEVKCEACGWRTADIDSSATGTPIREKRCAMCKARHLKYTGSSPAKAHKGGSH